LGQIFLLAGINKITAFGGMQAYMESMGMSGLSVIPAIPLEVAGAWITVGLGNMDK